MVGPDPAISASMDPREMAGSSPTLTTWEGQIDAVEYGRRLSMNLKFRYEHPVTDDPAQLLPFSVASVLSVVKILAYRPIVTPNPDVSTVTPGATRAGWPPPGNRHLGTRLRYHLSSPARGLGCVALWRDVPECLAKATGYRVFAYSRFGYGQSDPAELPAANELYA